MQATSINHAWNLVDLPTGRKTMELMVLKLKRKEDGSIEQYMARLVKT